MSNPRQRKLRESEKDVLDAAMTKNITYGQFSLKHYEWGTDNNKTAFLVHGWEGQTGNFASLIPVLLKANYKIISIDAPSHGKSSKGATNMFAFANILEQHFKTVKPDLVISHSFGSVNVARVLRLYPEINLDLWILVTTPNNFKSRINEMAAKFKLSQKVTQKLILSIQKDVNEDINDLNMVTYCNTLSNVKKAAIIHSKSDRVLPIEGAREVNRSFKPSNLIELDNYGHYSILWSEELKSILSNLLSKTS